MPNNELAAEITTRFKTAPIVPLVQSNDPDEAIHIAHALVAGGLTVLEVVLRTDAAIECLRAIAAEVDAAVVGAGTVLDSEQADRAIAAGSQFIVSPGFDDGVTAAASAAGLPMYPGVVTATELMRARQAGLSAVKFFPASIAGGVPALKALASVFRTMQFMPTGGVSAANLAEYLAVPAVVACGGSWLTPADAIRDGDFARLTALASEARAIAAGAGRG